MLLCAHKDYSHILHFHVLFLRVFSDPALKMLYAHTANSGIIHFHIIIIQIFISTKRHELADHIFCIPMLNCLIADTEVPENAHMAYRVKFLLNEMFMS